MIGGLERRQFDMKMGGFTMPVGGFSGIFFEITWIYRVDWLYRDVKKEQPPHTRGWPNTQIAELPPFQPPSLQGWFFCARFRDLENVTD